MTTLAIDVARPFEIGPINALEVVAADIIYQGAAVGDNGSGYARPLVAGDPFRGFALRKANNALGADGAIRVEVQTEGWVVLAIAGLSIADVGKDVFASDDNAFTLTQGSNTRIGHIHRVENSSSAVVRFSANASRLTELTDSSGGTPSDTLAAIGGSYVEATIENTVASLAAKINAVIRRMGG